MVQGLARLRSVVATAVALAVSASAWAQAAQADTLEFALLLSRHGVRSSLYTDKQMQPLSAKPWPVWEVAPGILTPRGGELVRQMGHYYRDYYVSKGLLSGKPSEDASRIFVRSDNDQRTLATSHELMVGLMGGVAVPFDPHALPVPTPDPLFQPLRAKAFTADVNLGAAAVLGRIGGNPEVIERAYARQFADLKRVLYGEASVPADSPFRAKAEILPGEWDNLVKFSGPLRAALITTESMLLEYVDGKPPQEVGWGNLNGPLLTELLELHSLYFDLTARTFYPAQVQGSNLLSHILSTLDQAASGKPVEGAIGKPGERLVIVTGHDTNVANIGGLLDAHWWIDGSQRDPVLPGGALSFELWRHADGQLYVRTAYVCQTLDQMRADAPLSLATPPDRVPIFVPACGGSAPSYDAKLEAFKAHALARIDPAFVVHGSP